MMSTSRSGRRVVVVEPGYETYDTERRILAPFHAEVEPVTWDGGVDVITQALRGADAALVRESPVNAEALAGMASGAIVVRYGVGVDNIDLAAARERQIYVANIPSYGVDEVSDHATALLLAVYRRIVSRDREVRDGAWGVGQKRKIYALRGGTLGIVGFGRIARRAMAKMQVFGLDRVLVHDPYLAPDAAAETEVEKVDLDTLCRESDVITLHAPLNDETRHMINADRLAMMKPTTILVNVGRGPLVDETALVEALRDARLLGAGIDVFDEEPPPADHPLFALDNVVLSDHAAWYSEQSVQELQTLAAEEIARVFGGGEPKAWLNRWDAT